MRPKTTIKFIETCCWFLSECGMRFWFRVINTVFLDSLCKLLIARDILENVVDFWDQLPVKIHKRGDEYSLCHR